MGDLGRIRGVYGGPVASKMQIPVTRDLLEKLGECLVDAFFKEAKKDFAKRGWSGEAEDGSAMIWDSFSFKIRGESTLEVLSTYPHLDELTTRNTPRYRMTWLTQEAKNTRPTRYALTDAEKKKGMKRAGRVRDGDRMPLVVPIKPRGGGTVVFRTAPLKLEDAWVHPGIARFTFIERAVRTGKAGCIKILQAEALKGVVKALSQ